MGGRKRKQPTLREVAELAGTSTAVVSYVVNSGPRPVATATRARVQRAIDELGYRPNRAARTLASNRSHAIGLVVPDTTNAFFSDLVRAVEREARSGGLITLVGNTDYDPDHERDYVEAFEDYGADGIIVVSANLVDPWRAVVSTPLVFLHRRPLGARGPVVRTDDARGGRMATEHLLGVGRGPVHCVTGHEDAGPTEERVEAWRLAVNGRSPRSTTAGDLIRVGYPRSEAAEGLGLWLASLTLPAAVFVTTDEQALGLLSAAANAGIRIPEDLAVIGYDNTSASASSVPPLTTISMPLPDIARVAVERLLADKETDADYCADVELVIRSSCGT